MKTYHDSTINGHFRVSIVISIGVEMNELVQRYGKEICPPIGIDSWPVYTRYAHDDARVHVVSKKGD